MKNNKNKTKNTTLSKQVVKSVGHKKLTEQQLVQAMIRDDLVNYRLLNGLHELGLVTELYFLKMSQTVFDYLGIEGRVEYDANYARYEEMKEEVMAFDLSREMGRVNQLAEKIYRELLTIKFMQEKAK
jgi:hypothetical protein